MTGRFGHQPRQEVQRPPDDRADFSGGFRQDRPPVQRRDSVLFLACAHGADDAVNSPVSGRIRHHVHIEEAQLGQLAQSRNMQCKHFKQKIHVQYSCICVFGETTSETADVAGHTHKCQAPTARRSYIPTPESATRAVKKRNLFPCYRELEQCRSDRRIYKASVLPDWNISRTLLRRLASASDEVSRGTRARLKASTSSLMNSISSRAPLVPVLDELD
ncbi:hypothetical protein V8C35DRAFT_285853 [Trichoderma chlorosporum]